MEIFVARQPIFDRRQAVFGYELFYRSSPDSAFGDFDGDEVAAKVIVNSFMNIGIEPLTRSRRAFINFNKQLLDQGAALLFPSQSIAIEIVGKVEPDENTINACRNLKEQGYMMAIDDFTYADRNSPLIGFVDMAKVDLLHVGQEELEKIAEFLRAKKIKFIAKNIENKEQHLLAKELGCDMFQGFFFCKPEIIQSREIPEIKMHYLQLLREIYRTEMDYDRLERLIKQDVSLSYKLLKFINSVEFKLRFEIRSIRQAIALLGQKHLIRWASLVSLRSIGQDKPGELIITALTRARFCEELAGMSGKREIKDDLYLMGLFSLLDVFLGLPLETILYELPLAEDIIDALLGKENELSGFYRLTLAYERADWPRVEEMIFLLGLSERVVAKSYLEALKETEMMAGF